MFQKDEFQVVSLPDYGKVNNKYLTEEISVLLKFLLDWSKNVFHKAINRVKKVRR